jgi:hypothetical protein
VCDVTGGYDGGCAHLHTAGDGLGDEGHRCARGAQCKERTPVRDEKNEPVRDDDGKPTWLPAAITVPRGLCSACVSDVEHALNHLTGDVVELTAKIGRGGMAGEVIVSASPDLQIPIQVNLDALRTEIDSELQNWAQPVADELGMDWPSTTMLRRTRLAHRVQRAAHLLVSTVDTLLALPEQEHLAWRDGLPVVDPELGCQDTILRDGVTGAIALIELHRLAYSTLGRTDPKVVLPQPCPICSWRSSLVRRNGQDYVECEHCHKIVPEPLLDWLAKHLVEAERLAAEAELERQEQAA